MEVPPALRDLTNQGALEENSMSNMANGSGTPADSKGSGSDEHLQKIVKQCEFYFSDANILKDQFMLNKVKANKDGWMKLAIVEGFKKMQQLTQDHNTVLRALALSTKLEVSEDGSSVRRRDPLPEWDSSVYYRSVVISEFPAGTLMTRSDLTDFFTDQELPPVLLRMLLPNRKVPSDLKRSQVLHPLMGVKLSAVIEFSNRDLAAKAITVASKKWPDAYIHLLSDGSKNNGGNTKKKKERKQPAKEVEKSSGRPAFLLNLRQPVQTVQVVHIREPIGPPSEGTLGFIPGWRELIRLERMCLAKMNGHTGSALSSTDPVHHQVIPDHSIVPNDSAIVSIVPSASTATFPTSPPIE